MASSECKVCWGRKGAWEKCRVSSALISDRSILVCLPDFSMPSKPHQDELGLPLYLMMKNLRIYVAVKKRVSHSGKTRQYIRPFGNIGSSRKLSLSTSSLRSESSIWPAWFSWYAKDSKRFRDGIDKHLYLCCELSGLLVHLAGQLQLEEWKYEVWTLINRN